MTTPEDVNEAKPARLGRFSCNQCGRRWDGLGQAHCAGCHAHFSVVRMFDAHRVGVPGADARRCRTSAEMIALTRKNGDPVFGIRDTPHGRIWTGYRAEGGTDDE